jgi:hypothetical protein
VLFGARGAITGSFCRKHNKVVDALRAPAVPLPGKNILQPIKQSVNTYRTSIDNLLYRLFTIVAGKLRYFGSSGICSYAF